MVEYDAEWIKKKFRNVAHTRIKQKERGDNRYAGDAGYWEGGRCNWGANHNLDEDCHTLAEAFRKINELKDPKTQLLACSSREEFNTVKDKLLRRANDAEQGLSPSIGAHSSMFGICIIWGSFEGHLEKQTRDFRKKIREIKDSISREDYSGTVELKRLQFEAEQIKARMEENKRKAAQEKDPAQKAILIQLIEEDGRKLKENVEKQKKLPLSKLSFDPDSYIKGILDALNDSVNNPGGGNNPGGNGSGGNRNKNKDKNGSGGNGGNGGDGGSGDNDDKDPKPPRGKKEEKKEKDNSQMIFIALAVIVLFFLMSQKDNSSHRRDYEEFDYY